MSIATEPCTISAI